MIKTFEEFINESVEQDEIQEFIDIIKRHTGTLGASILLMHFGLSSKGERLKKAYTYQEIADI